MHDKSDSFLQYMEFHIHRSVREKCRFHKKLFCSTGNVILRNIDDVYAFTFQYNTAVEQGVFGQPASPEQFLKAGQLNAMGLIDEIFHYMCRLYRRDVCADFFSKGYRFTDDALQSKKLPPLDSLLTDFCTLFPPAAVYTGAMTVPEWFCGADPASNLFCLNSPIRILLFSRSNLFSAMRNCRRIRPIQCAGKRSATGQPAMRYSGLSSATLFPC